ncbi:hypothetical protein SAMN04489752_1640 [Brevibacterium siliguriense]|uniref:Uncharacterized protein n=1 Tax=Brevibacterium siliguriense TaxID=1136497 RepID=A0A1H1RX77_9MICO|nr:hypothetical protein SAMN04489752_1640 [Brevibacterium siliguriense]
MNANVDSVSAIGALGASPATIWQKMQSLFIRSGSSLAVSGLCRRVFGCDVQTMMARTTFVS